MTTYNLASLLEDTTQKYPDREAIVLGDIRLTYAQVNGAANQVANLLASRGIGRGDKVALSCANLPYFPMVYFGILKAGATVVPLNVLLKAREVAYHLGDSDAKAYFCFQGTEELPIGKEGHAGFEQVDGCEHFWMITIDPAAASPIEGTETLGQGMAEPPTFDTVGTDEDDTAVILYTSGTTGQPKGAELRHRNMRDNALLGDLFGADAENPDTLLCVLPLFHSFGQSVIQNGGFAYGGTVVMLPRFDADASLKTMQGGSDLLRRRTHDVLGPARRPGRLASTPRSSRPTSGWRWPAARRCRWRCTRSSSSVRRHHPGGVRPVGDLAGGELLPVRQGRAGRVDRRGRPGRGDEADRARHLGRGRGTSRTRSARSRSRATTS